VNIGAFPAFLQDRRKDLPKEVRAANPRFGSG
jgi:hypothetical protein